MNAQYGGWLRIGIAHCYPLAVEEFKPVFVGKDHLHLHGVLLFWFQPSDSDSKSWEHSPV